ncbi:hypothetical protein GGR52DRAFT_386008 [Hypoxylon sp. FL1284]|nr:hypothetical protein GGR52DRAFT_386008 [Hypoxylon sp. FL1284]
MPATTTSKAAPKHRACDECRSRKLACTKEPGGCSRCEREGITCHYSLQKPMGRPRKRPRDEASGENTTIEPATQDTAMDIPPDATTDSNFLMDIISSGEDAYQALENGLQEKGYPWRFGYTGDSLGDIGFDPAPEPAPPLSSSDIDPSLFGSAMDGISMAMDPPSADQVPSLSPNAAGTPESAGSAPLPSTPSSPAASCSHTAALYLALDSMQQAPGGVEEAIGRARRATKTAYDVVYCPTCSFKIEPPGPADEAAAPAAMRNFQNMMLLAALIPSIAHAYERILRAVDEEACRATAERRRLVFKLRGFGGIIGDADAPRCPAGGLLDHREMEPALWRLTVRALLKADVYGLAYTTSLDTAGDGGVAGAPPPLHLGLKDIVLQMEQTSRARHAVMDVLVSSGAWQDPVACGSFRLHAHGETPTCQKVIAIAKASIDGLVIA